MRETLSDELFEVVLKQAVYDAEKAEQDELPDSEALNETYPMPQSLQDEIAALQKKKHRRGTRSRLAKRIAIVAVSLLAVVFGVLMTQPEIRASVSHIVVQQFQKFALFRHDDNGEPKHYLTVDDVEIGYIPEGYELTSVIEDDTIRLYDYRSIEDTEQYVMIDIGLASNTDIGMDNEHEYEVFYVNHREVHFSYDKDDQSGAAVIIDENIIINIAGRIGENELKTIAKNIN